MVTSVMTPEAFYAVYKEVLSLTADSKAVRGRQLKAYEKTEDIHEILHGQRRYSCYRAFIKCCIEYPFVKRHKELFKKEKQTSLF
jgi:hypothetical protein